MNDLQTIEQLIQANHAAIQQAIDTNAGPDDWAKIEENIQKQIELIRDEARIVDRLMVAPV